MQNIPHDQIYRSCFIAQPGYSLVTCDLSAAELRILACMSNDKLFVETFLSGQDLHTVSASRVFNVPMEEVTKSQRTASKAITFGLCVDEDTELFTSYGQLRIADALIGDKVAHDLGSDYIIDKAFMGEKEVFELVTEYGYTLRCTEDHVIKVCDHCGVYIDKALRDINVGVDKACLVAGSRMSVGLDEVVWKPHYADHKTLRHTQLELLNTGLVSEIKTGGVLLPLFEHTGLLPLNILSIKSVGKSRVYDISVNNHQYFLANGFVVHNCYGLSKHGLSKRLDITVDEAELMISKYFSVYHGIKRFLEGSASNAVRDGFSRSISGRKRYYDIPYMSHPDYKKIVASVKRQAKNHPIQGCLVGDTIVSGVGRIDTLVGKRIRIQTGFGLDNAVGVYSGEKDVFDLRLSNGTVLGITEDHQIPVVRGNSIQDVCVRDLSHDDYVLIPTTPVEGTVTDVSGFAYQKGHWRESFVNYNLPESMDERLAFVVGCLLGDGNYSKHNNFSLVAPAYEVEILNKFNSYIEELFGYTPVTVKMEYGRNTPLYKSQVSSVVIRGFLEHIGLGRVVNRGKIVPELFHTETIPNRCALLNGLFSTDGGMTKCSGPAFTSVSKFLAEDVHRLLLSLGINSNLKTYHNAHGEVYRLQIPKRFNKTFHDLIGFSVTKKQNELLSTLDARAGGDLSIVPPFIPKAIEALFRGTGIDIYNNMPYNDKALLRRFKLGICSFDSVRRFFNLLPECDEKCVLSRYLNYDYCKVVSKTYRGKEKTYDLMCDNIHYFVANGVVVHNSNGDIIKQSMIDLLPRLESYDAKLLLTVHDEIVVEVRDEQRHEVMEIVRGAMVSGYDRYFSTVPMLADPVVGPCWLKGMHEKTSSGEKCGCTEMISVHDEKYGTKTVCKKCGDSVE